MHLFTHLQSRPGWWVPSVLVIVVMAHRGSASEFGDYQRSGTFHFPTSGDPADQGPVVFDNLSDGRLVGVSTLITDPDTTFSGLPKLYLETVTGSRQFELVGDLPLPAGGQWSSGGGAFLRVSPGAPGERIIAVGNNRFDSPLVGLFHEADLLAGGPAPPPVDWFPVAHFDAAWLDDRYLAISSGTFGSSDVRLLDTNSPPTAPLLSHVIGGIAGASGGVGFDASDNLYTANGFSDGTPGASRTGTIKRFDADQWRQAVASSTPLNFEASGREVATILSGGSLVFDRQDNLLVGGSDFFGGGQANFFALVPGPDQGDTPRTFDPDADATSFYALAYNDVTHEFYANEPFPLDFPPNIDPTRVFTYRAGLPGDMDGDGDVDFDDVGALVLALSDPPAYEKRFGLPATRNGDLNGDGDVDFDDIGPFVGLLDPPAAVRTVPEPASWSLAMLGLAAVLAMLRREVPDAG